jgi:hypothetical protein
VNKIQKTRQFLQSNLGFSIFLFILIVLLFSLLSPKVSSLLFPFKRQTILNEFINNIKTEKSINPQNYWKFREFYSPGSFNFSKTGLSPSLVEQAVKKIGIKYDNQKITLTDLLFSSQKLNSLDMLTKQTNLNDIVDLKQFKKEQVLLEGGNYLVYQENAKTIKIIFLLPNSELEKANGFFDYKDTDKKITEGENWFNVTSIKQD